MATAFRFDTVRPMTLAALNRITSEVEVVPEGGKVRQGRSTLRRLARFTASCGRGPTLIALRCADLGAQLFNTVAKMGVMDDALMK